MLLLGIGVQRLRELRVIAGVHSVRRCNVCQSPSDIYQCTTYDALSVHPQSSTGQFLGQQLVPLPVLYLLGTQLSHAHR